MQLKHDTFPKALTQARAFIKGNKAAQDTLGQPAILLQIVESKGKFYLETHEDAGSMIRVWETLTWSFSDEQEEFHDECYKKLQ